MFSGPHLAPGRMNLSTGKKFYFLINIQLYPLEAEETFNVEVNRRCAALPRSVRLTAGLGMNSAIFNGHLAQHR